MPIADPQIMSPPVLPPPAGPPPPPPRLHEVLWGLFFNPGCIFQVDGTLMWRGLRLLALAAVLGGMVLGMAQYPGLRRTTLNWATWFGEQTGAITLAGGEVRWERPVTLPYVTRHEGWRIEFHPRGTPMKLESQHDPERQGMWIAPDLIKLWWRPMEGRVVELPVLQDKKIWGVFPMAWALPDGLALTGPEMTVFIRHTLWQMLPFFLVQSGLGTLFEVFLYTLLFASIPMLLRQTAGGGWRRALAFYAFAGIPAVIVASVYAALGLPYLDFGSAFVFAFVLYLLLAMRAARKAAATGKPPATDDADWF